MDMLVDTNGVAHHDPLCDLVTYPGLIGSIPADRLAANGLTVCADCEPTTEFPAEFLESIANDAGRMWGEAVREGRASESEAGDAWKRFADGSHAAGVAFRYTYEQATR